MNYTYTLICFKKYGFSQSFVHNWRWPIIEAIHVSAGKGGGSGGWGLTFDKDVKDVGEGKIKSKPNRLSDYLCIGPKQTRIPHNILIRRVFHKILWNRLYCLERTFRHSSEREKLKERTSWKQFSDIVCNKKEPCIQVWTNQPLWFHCISFNHILKCLPHASLG